MEYVMSIDLGQSRDYTALAILKKEEQQVRKKFKWEMMRQAVLDAAEEEDGRLVGGNSRKTIINLGYLSRFALGTSYVDITREVALLLGREPYKGRTQLVVDKTGVGIAVVDMMRDAGLDPIPVTITGGQSVGGQSWGEGYTVPKRDLVGALSCALQQYRLKIQKDLKLAPIFVKEAANFRYKISASGHDTYDAARESVHDDIVLSVAIGVWYCDFAGAGLQIFI
jgi:hypothetical protein